MKTFFKHNLLLLSFLFFGSMAFGQGFSVLGITDTAFYVDPCVGTVNVSFSLNSSFATTANSNVHYDVQTTTVPPNTNVTVVINWGDGTTNTYIGTYFSPTSPLSFGGSPPTHTYPVGSTIMSYGMIVTISDPISGSTLSNNNVWITTGCTTQIYGIVDVDCDSNGVVDTTLYDNVVFDLIHNTGTVQTVSMNNGVLQTAPLTNGSYSIVVNQAWLIANGYTTLYINPNTFSVQPGSPGAITFQAYLICDSIPPPSTGCVVGQVFCDTDGDGMFGTNDYGVYNAPISVSYNGQTLLSYTDPNGYYYITANNGNQSTAVVSVDAAWLGQNGYLFGQTSDTVLVQPCQTTGNTTIVNFPMNCDSVQMQQECIFGYIFCDANGNGVLDSAEVGIPNAPVTLSGTGTYTTTVFANSNGYFSYSGPAYFGGVAIATVPTWWLTQHGYVLGNNVATATTDCNNPTPLYFGVNCSPTPCADLWTAVTPWIGYYQNQNNYVKLKWGNYGPNATTGYTLTLTFPSSVTPDVTSIWNSNYVLSGNTITWTFGPGSSSFYQQDVIKFFVPSGYPSGTSHVYSSVITPLGATGDCDSLNNDGSLCMILGNSYDPNDKSTSLQPIINPDVQDELTYVIRFQNTGTAPAQDVYIMDSLSSLLDWSTLKVISASHNMQLIDQGNGVIKFNFPGIWLPDSTINEPASHGDVIFTIKENVGNAIGSTIENTGYIYFDWNPAIITNTTLNTNAYLGLEDVAVNEVSVYPNPFADKVTIASAKRMDKLTILDITGKVIYEEIVDGFNTNVQMDHILQGTYLVRVSAGSETSIVRIVKK